MEITMTSGQIEEILRAARAKGMNPERMTKIIASGALHKLFDAQTDPTGLVFGRGFSEKSNKITIHGLDLKTSYEFCLDHEYRQLGGRIVMGDFCRRHFFPHIIPTPFPVPDVTFQEHTITREVNDFEVASRFQEGAFDVGSRGMEVFHALFVRLIQAHVREEHSLPYLPPYLLESGDKNIFLLHNEHGEMYALTVWSSQARWCIDAHPLNGSVWNSGDVVFCKVPKRVFTEGE